MAPDKLAHVLEHAWTLPAADRIAHTATSLEIDAGAALELLAGQLGLESLEPSDFAELLPDFALASYPECARRRCVLAKRAQEQRGHEGELFFICVDPLDLPAQQWFEAAIERRAPGLLRRAVASPEVFSDYLSRAKDTLRAIDEVRVGETRATEAAGSLKLSLVDIANATSDVVRLVDSTLYDALRSGASDIHLETEPEALQIKYRMDGVLQPIKRIDGAEFALQAISRIKVLSDLDIAERRTPQDGRFRVVLDGREIDFRVSVMPNLSGEDAVLRVLDRKHLTGEFDSLTLDRLQLQPETCEFVRRASRLPYGLLLVTGPTGSGKTTTLYAAISEINTGLDKIITIEDPIEYQLRGVLQIPVNEKKGLTFAKGLRSILRHDPDKIMVGEIRDSETAQIAVQAALTGHQVFTTVHANNVFDVIGRFSNMGIDSYSLVAALSGIMAQRLVRRLCDHCAQAVDDKAATGELTTLGQTLRMRRPCGCERCRNTGYKGRVAIAETLRIDDDLRELLVSQSPINRIKKLAAEKGFRNLRHCGLVLAAQGLTSLEEIDRVAPAELS